MKVFSVVGNRPQFVKAAPTSVGSPRTGNRGGRAAHRAALRPRALAGVLRGARARRAAVRARVCEPPTPEAMRQAIHPALRRRAARLGARLRRHELDPGGSARGVASTTDIARTRRGRAAQRRPLDAGGAQSHRDRPPGAAAPLSRRALARAARSRGSARPRRGGRRRDGRRLLQAHARGAEALARSRGARRGAGPLPPAHDPPRGERPPNRASAASRRAQRARGAGRLPGPPTHARGTRRRGDRARPARPPAASRSAIWT